MKTHILGFPRIGEKRQLKFALEQYWQEKISQDELVEIANKIKLSNWKLQANAGLDFVTVGDFSFYDHVLDTSIMFGVIPNRFQLTAEANTNPLDKSFCIARGKTPNHPQVRPSAMTKWFNTNYHYIKPEIVKAQKFSLNSSKLIDEIKHAQHHNFRVKPVILGPISFLYLSHIIGDDFDKFQLLPDLIAEYNKLFSLLAKHNISWVQIDEPILSIDIDKTHQNHFKSTYHALNKDQNISLLLTSYFGDNTVHLDWLSELPIAGIHLDLIETSIKEVSSFIQAYSQKKVISLGIIDGRNIWKNNLLESIENIKSVNANIANIWIGSSCSLLHCPYDADLEYKLDPTIKSWLSFAKQKVSEIALLKNLYVSPNNPEYQAQLSENIHILETRKTHDLLIDTNVRNRVKKIRNVDFERKSPYKVRQQTQKQALNLPIFPTTTIGSFPQTHQIRHIRKQYRQSEITLQQYIEKLKEEIKQTIRAQEEINLDVLVHGEAERNDMVEYFGQHLKGITTTSFGWVQSYGSRCVKPPVIYGDISRPHSITVEWSSFAQSLTQKHVKGMLTGPITILSWSFARDDISAKDIATQIAIALRDEVLELESAGIKIIQIDEPAFKEMYPLKKSKIPYYLNWAIKTFKLASCGVKDQTQIHTHMCYSAFNDIIHEINQLDADVITIESARADMSLLSAFKEYQYTNAIGPGIYDIHSPNIPSVMDMYQKAQKILHYISVDQLWINPDCGLKTRSWQEVNIALKNMVSAADKLRLEIAKHKDLSTHEINFP
ncbi:5-methyltetrahydropteroyltriglutamate--homocysteine S-methyltransferase [Cysteiniphilum halobium]|uniref:5-methyltetrahydropteroyltriglutamate-- homocysteine S-methyltransferase n=1 Tax=Cysteiniphilum halobium TaxID=2219059 RepID=UPI000E649180|nr:5-methyltetrahydropteroyltriglutamate--homocysteine S-methyltransferase [Cysteiniphilum halobium]